jgi:hypothetical protein
MNKNIAYCGLVCSSCPILLATDKGNEEKTWVAELVKNQYHKECTADDISCDGCLTDGPRIWKECAACPIRKCAKQRNVKSCAYCTEYPCGTLNEFFKSEPDAKKTLDKIKKEASFSIN